MPPLQKHLLRGFEAIKVKIKKEILLEATKNKILPAKNF
jgi:hypothetical protein